MDTMARLVRFAFCVDFDYVCRGLSSLRSLRFDCVPVAVAFLAAVAAEDGGDDEANQAGQLDEDVHRRSAGVLEGVTDRVTGYSSLVRF